TADVALVMLEFDEMERLLPQDEQIDLGPRSSRMDELEVAPAIEGRAIRQPVTHVGEALAFVGVLRLGDDVPTLTACLHASSRDYPRCALGLLVDGPARAVGQHVTAGRRTHTSGRRRYPRGSAVGQWRPDVTAAMGSP